MLSINIVSYIYKVNDDMYEFLVARRGLMQEDPLSAMLFLLVMEYLPMVMHKLKTKPNFNYHSKCEKLDIINLSFADDLLLFAREDSISVNLLMGVFNRFTNSTDL